LKFVADEGIERQIVERLRQKGHSVWYVAEMDPGISDKDVLNVANHEQAILLTADKDFGELVYRQRLINPGVILVRLAGLLSGAKAEIVAKAISSHAEEFTRGFAVITRAAVRIRRPEE
jgi:predicted nuclease of predicted toxin-antitoxin system